MISRSKFFVTAMVLVPVFIAGCRGAAPPEESGGNGAAGTGKATTENAVLLDSFLDSLDSVRTQADRLLSGDARYRRQTAPSGMYIDVNNNGRLDSNRDVVLEGNPIEDAGIHYAHAAGLTGRGQVIAFSDSGFRANHEAFSGKSVSTGDGLAVDDHGTFVASIATGNSDSMIGVAPEADAIFGSFDTYTQLRDTALAAANAGAVALNNSWGFSNTSATSADHNRVFGTTNGGRYLSALKTYARDGVVIFSMSNNRDLSTAGLMAGLPALEPSLEDSWIAVVNGVPVHDGDDIIAAERVSGPCLQAAPWCISANGSWTGATASSRNSYEFGTGTSYAAPMVAGAMALLAEAFPDMSHQDLRIRLLASADNDFDGFSQSGTVELVPGFEHAYSEEWGHGFLDVAAALLPIGQPTVTTRNGTVISTNEPLVVSGSASGDAVSRSLRNVEVASTDALSATFAVDASQWVASRAAPPIFSLRDAITFDRDPISQRGSAAFFGDTQTLPVQWGDAAYDVSLFRSHRSGDQRVGFGLSRDFDLGGATLQIGAAHGEDLQGLLSEWNSGTSARISSFDFGLSTDLGAQSALSMELGYAFGQEASNLGQAADVVMNGGAVTFSRRNALARNDRLSLSLSMPAAIASGSTSVSLPVMRASGAIKHQNLHIDLAPRARELRLGLNYHRPLSRSTDLAVSLAYAHNRGHIAGRRETALMFGLRTRF